MDFCALTHLLKITQQFSVHNLVSSMWTQSLWGKKVFCIMESEVYLWVVWVLFAVRRGPSALWPSSDPWILLQCTFSCLAMGILFGTCRLLSIIWQTWWCPVLLYLWSCIFLISDLDLFWFTRHLGLYKAPKNFSCLLCTTSECVFPTGSHCSIHRCCF